MLFLPLLLCTLYDLLRCLRWRRPWRRSRAPRAAAGLLLLCLAAETWLAAASFAAPRCRRWRRRTGEHTAGRLRRRSAIPHLTGACALRLGALRAPSATRTWRTFGCWERSGHVARYVYTGAWKTA